MPDPSQEAVELPDGVETLNVFSTRSGASAAVLVSDLPAIEAQVLERVREGLLSDEALEAMSDAYWSPPSEFLPLDFFGRHRAARAALLSRGGMK